MLHRKSLAMMKADVAWFFGEGLLGPLFAVFTQKIGGDILDITYAWGVYLVITGIFIIIFGKLSDRILNRKKLLFAGYVLNAVLTFGYLFVNNPLQLLILQAGLGFAVAMATPTWNALYSKYQHKEHRGLAWGLSDGLSQLFTGIAVILGGFVLVYFSFNILFVIMGIIQIIAVILLIPILKED